MTNNEIKTVEKIRGQYEDREETKVEKLKALDRKVKKTPRVFSYTYGALASLVLGTGMCLAMGVIGSGTALMIAGIGIGIGGIVLTASTYPVYKKMLASSKKKHASEIIELSAEILNNK